MSSCPCTDLTDDPSPRSFTLLHLVCGLGLDDAAALLLQRPERSADPREASNHEGVTPLHAAAMAASLPCVNLLLKHGVCVLVIPLQGCKSMALEAPPPS